MRILSKGIVTGFSAGMTEVLVGRKNSWSPQIMIPGKPVLLLAYIFTFQTESRGFQMKVTRPFL